MTAGRLASWPDSRSFRWHGRSVGNSAAIVALPFRLPYIVSAQDRPQARLPMTLLRSLLLGFVLAVLGPSGIGRRSAPTPTMPRCEKGMNALVAKMGETRPIARLRITPGDIEVAGAGRQRRRLPAMDRQSRRPRNCSTCTWSPVRRAATISPLSTMKAAPSSPERGGARPVRRRHRGLDRLRQAERRSGRHLVEIARAISILPEPAHGEIRWTVTLKTASGRQSSISPPLAR